MRHPLHPSFSLPDTFTALVEYLMEGLDPADPEVWQFGSWLDRGGDVFCGDVSPSLLGEPNDDPLALCGELAYVFQPMEILPFCWNGGDGLHYGWAVLAPELDSPDQPCVSFASLDERAVWLGDDTRQALENLLVGALANWHDRGRAQGLPSPAEDFRVLALCRALDLRPDFASPWITAGARSTRELQPVVPQGWRYAPTDDGIGVLAPAAAFDADTAHPAHPADVEDNRQLARGFLDRRLPGSALCVLKSMSCYDTATVCLLAEAYRQLGRRLHVERAELWLRLHSSD